MGLGPALGYRAMPLGEINERLNADTALIVMLETAEGIDNAAAIAALPGIDVLLIGSGDLTTDYGIPGQVDHPRLREAYERVADACRTHGKVLGVGGIRHNVALQGELIRLGARFVIAGHRRQLRARRRAPGYDGIAGDPARVIEVDRPAELPRAGANCRAALRASGDVAGLCQRSHCGIGRGGGRYHRSGSVPQYDDARRLPDVGGDDQLRAERAGSRIGAAIATILSTR